MVVSKYKAHSQLLREQLFTVTQIWEGKKGLFEDVHNSQRNPVPDGEMTRPQGGLLTAEGERERRRPRGTQSALRPALAFPLLILEELFYFKSSLHYLQTLPLLLFFTHRANRDLCAAF